MFIGLAVVAVWIYVRFPTLRPGSLVVATLHVAFSFLGFSALPAAIRVLLPLLHAPTVRVSVGMALLIPALTYVLLSWVWLLARILQELIGGPRGGHPIASHH